MSEKEARVTEPTKGIAGKWLTQKWREDAQEHLAREVTPQNVDQVDEWEGYAYGTDNCANELEALCAEHLKEDGQPSAEDIHLAADSALVAYHRLDARNALKRKLREVMVGSGHVDR